MTSTLIGDLGGRRPALRAQARRQLAGNQVPEVAEATGSLRSAGLPRTEADDLYPFRQRQVNYGEVQVHWAPMRAINDAVHQAESNTGLPAAPAADYQVRWPHWQKSG